MGGRKRTEPDGGGAAKRASGPGLRRIGFVGFKDALALDIVGPMEVFSLASAIEPGRTPRYRCVLIGLNRRPFVTESGLVIRPDFALADSPALDTLVIPGGARVVPQYTLDEAPRPDLIVIGAQSDNGAKLLAWLESQHASRVTIMSVCTGARKLALAGLLDGKSATSHHEYLAEFQKKFPQVRWQASRRYVRSDETIYTAGGLTSGIDLALHLVAVRFGAQVAQKTADYIEYRGDGWKQAD